MFRLFKTENKTIHLTDESWDKEILQFKGTALVDVWAPWCGPCKLLGPLIDEISNEVDENIKICKLNSDENTKSRELGIRGIPSILYYKNGVLKETVVGLQNKNTILEKLQLYATE